MRLLKLLLSLRLADANLAFRGDHKASGPLLDVFLPK